MSKDNVLAKLQEIQAGEDATTKYGTLSRQSRPKNVRKVNNLQECYNWRREVIRDCENNYQKLFDITLSEEDVRKYNDQYNEYMDELYRWDKHIVQDLKGHSYKKNTRLHGAIGNRVNKKQHSRHGNRNSRVASIKKIDGKWYVGKALELAEIKEDLAKMESSRIQKELLLNDKAFLKNLDQNLNKKEYYKEIPDDYHLPQDVLDNFAGIDSDSDHKELENKIPEFVIPTKKDIEQWLVNKRKEKLKSVLE